MSTDVATSAAELDDELFDVERINESRPAARAETAARAEADESFARAERRLEIAASEWYVGFRKSLDTARDEMLLEMGQSDDITIGRLKQILEISRILDDEIEEAKELLDV